MTSFSTDTEVTRTVFVASTGTVLGLVVRFTSDDGTVYTVNRWTRDSTGYRSPLTLPAGYYRVTWSATQPNLANSYLTVVFDPAHIVAGTNVTVTENAEADSWTVSSTGGGGDTCTNIDGGFAGSSYSSIAPIDGGSA